MDVRSSIGHTKLATVLSKKALAFTIIELLTVVTVIGIVSALLLPAMTRAKGSARQVSCLGNLRQLGMAGQMYWDDNSGKAFRWRGASTNDGQIYWFGWMSNGTEGERRFDRTMGALYPYVEASGVEVCSSLNYGDLRFKRKALGASYGYGYNLTLSRPAAETPFNMSSVHCPVSLAFLADSAQVNTFQQPASLEHPMLEEFYYLSTTEPTVHFRHNQFSNVAFCDGHAGSARPAPGSQDNRLPREVIARLPNEALQND